MLHRTLVVFALILAIGQCFAATPVATVSSTAAITVSGVTVPTNRVISWPVALNDEIATQAAPAMVRFADGTVVTLQRNSRMRLNSSASGVEVKMLAGAAIYDLKPHTNVSVGDLITIPQGATVVRGGSPSMPAGMALRRASANEAVATAMAGGAQQPSSGVVMAPTGKLAAFVQGAKLRTQPNPVSDRITLPNGTILEVNLVSGGGPGGQSTYTINRIIFPVQDPNDGIIYITLQHPYDSPLIGASFMLPGATPFPKDATVPLHITLLNGTTLTPAQFADLLKQAEANAFSDPRNNLPPGAAPPPFPSPVDQGNFSGHAT